MMSFFSRVAVMRKGATEPPILICASLVSHPPTESYRRKSTDLFLTHNIGTIINVADCVSATPQHQQFYASHGVSYRELRIKDEPLESIPTEFFSGLLDLYNEHDKSRALLINCRSGVNRSALAAAYLIWTTTIERPWNTVDDLFFHMEQQQREQRDGRSLLSNTSFRDRLRESVVQHFVPRSATRV